MARRIPFAVCVGHAALDLLGAVDRPGKARWSELCAALATEHGLSELDVMAIVAASDDLAIDEARDAVSLARR